LADAAAFGDKLIRRGCIEREHFMCAEGTAEKRNPRAAQEPPSSTPSGRSGGMRRRSATKARLDSGITSVRSGFPEAPAGDPGDVEEAVDAAEAEQAE